MYCVELCTLSQMFPTMFKPERKFTHNMNKNYELPHLGTFVPESHQIIRNGVFLMVCSPPAKQFDHGIICVYSS